MKRFLLRLALSNVFKKRLRAFLTIGGVALSTAVMVLLFGLGMGLQKMVTAQISKTSLRNVITISSKDAKILKLNQGAVSKFQSISGVASVEQVANISGQVTYNGISLIIPVYAVSDHYFDLSPVTTLYGQTADQLSGQQHNIILSSAAVKALGTDKGILGKQTTVTSTITQDNSSKLTDLSENITAKDFVVRGVVDAGTSPVAYMPLDYLSAHGVDQASQVKVQVDYPQQVPTIRQAIEQLGYQTSNIQDSIDEVNRIFRVIKSILIAFGLITIMVTVFGTVNTITIELVEATKQIGFLRIIGIKQEEVGMLFVAQSVILAVSGAIIGVLVGAMIGLITNGAIAAIANQGASVRYGGVYVYQIPALPIIIMLTLAVGLGWAIGLAPARRAVRLNPLAALKS